MEKNNCHIEGCWISLVLRLAVVSLFGVAAIGKFNTGLDNVVGYFQSTFAETWLPESIVGFQARIIPFVEALIALWLLVGFKLRMAWVFTSLFTVSLAFGMAVAQKYDVAAHNYFYVFLCCMGIYFSQYDRLSVDGCKGENS